MNAPQRSRCSSLTSAGKPCKGYAMHGSDRCPSHQGLAGRKTDLTPELADQLCTIIAAGNYLTVACRAVGLPRRTFASWMKRGESEAEADAPFRDFRERVQVAMAKSEVRNVAAIAKAATESWAAAAWLLERQHPDRWGRPSVRVREEPVTGTPETETTPDPFAEVDELARRRATRGAV